VVAAMTLHPGTELTSTELERVLDRLPPPQRPDYVQVVPSIPVTTWHRPHWLRLAHAGVPKPSKTRRVWRLAEDRAHYTELPPS
jgi:putative long chain acyl-CoA synthase